MSSREGFWAAGKQFFRRNPGGFQGKIAPSRGQKTRRLGMLTFFKQALGQVEKALKAGDKVILTGFGSFEVKERAERTGRNPKTMEAITIPASKAPVFKPGKSLKDAVK